MNLIRVVIADDNRSVRDGLRRMLDRSQDILVVGEAADGIEAVHLVEESSPDILLLDIEMPGMNGYQVVEYFRSHPHPCKILVLSAYDILDIAITMLNNGISGYLTKEFAPEYLKDAICDIASGQEGWLSPAMMQKIAVWKNSFYQRIYMKPQQMQMLFLIIEGNTKNQIAEELGLNEHMVASSIQALQQMFGAENEKELLQIASDSAAGKVQVYPSQSLRFDRVKAQVER